MIHQISPLFIIINNYIFAKPCECILQWPYLAFLSLATHLVSGKRTWGIGCMNMDRPKIKANVSMCPNARGVKRNRDTRTHATKKGPQSNFTPLETMDFGWIFRVRSYVINNVSILCCRQQRRPLVKTEFALLG